jgi:NAD(P)-dependent dehydrogenase (short-subunit alcohol dehydrogenase family)
MKNNPFSLKNKNIIVVGASSGIGKSCAISCSKMGANLILIARNQVNLECTYKELQAGNHLVIPQDVTDFEKINGIFENIINKIGKIDGFIFAAGKLINSPLRMSNAKTLKEMFDVNTFAAMEFSRIAAKKRYSSDNSSFVFISSIMAIRGEIGKIGYCASKGALSAGLRAMAIELAKRRIRVNTILPGIVKSEMSKEIFDSISKEAVKEMENKHLLGFGKPEDIAYACNYLLSDAARWITGSEFIIDGGYSIR